MNYQNQVPDSYLNQVKVILPEQQYQNDAPVPPPQEMPQVPYSYFYIPPQIQQDEVFYFERPRKELDLKLFESIDPQKIVQTGDIQSVEFYLKTILNSKVTGRNKQLGTKSMSNAFTIMQLGAQYLTKLRANRYLPFGASPTANGDAYLMNLNEQLITNANYQISELSEIMNQLEFQVTRLQTDITKLRNKKRKLQDVVEKAELLKTKRKLQRKKKEHEQKKKKSLRRDELSEGQVPPSEINNFNTIQVKVGSLKFPQIESYEF
ncbi:hypothetical protein TVAG_457050 [Trichomonas vaginalis G3]|uniref:Cilium assembly protein DZIP1 N-terminal domain-containing protein n=1 Tax=Trichomonas vaginalis (strain ATCC PRA-98 / G3) TaxID=412133 RepID=A2DC29_TRIV3|nr:hypothetical protein TVAGG3_0263580 [Trichomonas vaginalis G3]EAY22070.1 hypothetical protein TVAG_457050 [Trichomonas vaginalis G3]KAI5525301.1 hypothetical protein TVAGG3_0263580 [Trichomonas vaginalis G3]|eukprot:XP_001583056.1 hypothetical protein [Trichomonas vaginalis G3]